MKEPHLATQWAAAIRAFRPGTSPEPAPARVVLKDISSRDDGRWALPKVSAIACVRLSHPVTQLAWSGRRDVVSMGGGYRGSAWLAALWRAGSGVSTWRTGRTARRSLIPREALAVRHLAGIAGSRNPAESGHLPGHAQPCALAQGEHRDVVSSRNFAMRCWGVLPSGGPAGSSYG
jgi:hypothetical protein